VGGHPQRSDHRRHWAAAAVTLLLALAALWPMALAQPQHGDETNRAWSGWYYVGLIRHPGHAATGEFADPGWDPDAYWSLTQPLGVSWVYGAAIHAWGAVAPQVPYDFSAPMSEATRVSPATLRLIRAVAVGCAAAGLALLALRLGWPAAVAVALFLAIPHVRADLSRATGDGPLLLGLGLCAAAYGTGWFAPLCGVAATLKLTGLALWPVAVVKGWGRGWYRHGLALLAAWGAWVALMPTSWRVGGFPFLLRMVRHRWDEYWHQSTVTGGYVGEVLAQERVMGLFLPTRYLWPLELGALLIVAYLAGRWVERRGRRPARTRE
jgi:hypothetical protein